MARRCFHSMHNQSSWAQRTNLPGTVDTCIAKPTGLVEHCDDALICSVLQCTLQCETLHLPSELGKSNLKQSITHKLLGIGCLLWNVDGGGHCCDVVVCK